MGYDLNKDYYKLLGLNPNASKDEITMRIIEIQNELNDQEKNYSQNYVIEMIKILTECEEVLLIKSNRIDYDKIHGFNTNENNLNDTFIDEGIQVTNVEENEKISNTGKKVIVAMTTLGLTIVVLSTVILGKFISDKEHNVKSYKDDAKVSISNTTNYASSAPILKSTNNDKTNSATTASIEEYTVDKVSSDIWNDVKELQQEDENYAPELTENNIINLVRWARHNGIVISNKDAFGQLFELAENPAFNIAEFTKGTNLYNGLNSYITSFDNVKQNWTLKDEDECINDINNDSDNLNKDSVVVANIVMAEMYAQRSQNMEVGLATKTLEGTLDNKLKDTLKTISNEEIMKNYATYNEFINSFDNAINKSEQEDATLKR